MNHLNGKHQKTILKVAEKLIKLRKDAGYSSGEAFANDHDLPRVQYWRMEKGTNFRFSTFLTVIEKHGISVGDFFCDLD